MQRKRTGKVLEVTDSARHDLAAIHRFIAASNPVKADQFVHALIRKIEWIAQTGFTGAPRNELGDGIRAFPFRNRCIYFYNLPDRIVILRILHGAQDISTHSFGGKRS